MRLNQSSNLAWAAFAKLKSILRSPKVKLNLKIRLFIAACISIILYGCETWILTETLIEKLESMREHATVSLCVTNQSLYQLTGQVPLRETIREPQLKFTGHCICMPTDELVNRFVIYESRIKSSLRLGTPRTTYLKNKFRRTLYNLARNLSKLER